MSLYDFNVGVNKLSIRMRLKPKPEIRAALESLARVQMVDLQEPQIVDIVDKVAAGVEIHMAGE